MARVNPGGREVDLKSTLNLPRTKFPMKANLPGREPEVVRRWDEMDLYGKLRAARRGRKIFVSTPAGQSDLI